MPISSNPSECIPKQKAEGKPQDQAVAICLEKERKGQITPCQRNTSIVKSARLLTAQIEFTSAIKKKLKLSRLLK